MKKLFMLFAFMGLVGVATVSAQTCSKSKAECTAAATKAASLNADIEKRICEKSGKVSFVRKSVCSTSGKTSYTNVEYNADTKKFVNVSPTHTSGKAAKAKATSAKGKTSCCAKTSKASCSKKSATAVKKTSTAKAAKAVKTSNQ